ncbi:unnamed protein product, partial [Rotaria magnacalcarata]
MLPRSSSFTSSCTESIIENPKPTGSFRHHESLQNLQQSQRQNRPMLSRPLNIKNSNQNHLPTISQNIKRTTTMTTTTTTTILVSTENLPVNPLNNEKKHDQQFDTIRRTIIQDDIENIQERLNDMLISVPLINDNETLLIATEQTSTTQYFTPKISIDEHGKKKFDDQDSQLDNDENQSDDDDDMHPMTTGTESA